MIFLFQRLLVSKKSVPLQRVFHSIRFKVNKGWSTAVLLFLCPYVSGTLFAGLVTLKFTILLKKLAYKDEIKERIISIPLTAI